MNFTGKLFVFCCLTFALSVASANHLHIKAPSARGPGHVACTFPDGTGLTSLPEVHCYTPEKFNKAYGIDQVHAQGITGKGQTIVLIDVYGSPTMQADLDHFSDTFGLPRTTIQFLYPDGVYVNSLSTADEVGWAEETTLDLEWAHAVGPGATIVNVVTTADELEGITGLPDIFKGISMATQKYPNSIISMSFAAAEPDFTQDQITKTLQGTFHQILEQASQANVTVLAGSGDWGTANMNFKMTSYLSTPNANYPASDPLVTAVGGTWLQANWKWDPQGTADIYWGCLINGASSANCNLDFFKYQDNTTVTEAVWKEDWLPYSAGGGVSSVFKIPAFQAGVGANNIKVMNGFRSLPDISMNAAVNGGVETYSSFVAPAFGVTAGWSINGGTSCSTPEMAGLVALAGNKASMDLKKSVGVGYLNPILYALPSSDLNDIVTQDFGPNHQVSVDTNALYFNAAVLAAFGPLVVPPVNVPGYSTTPGYDMATGLGSPKALNFVMDVAKAVEAR